MRSPELLADHKELHDDYRRLEALQVEVAALYERWAALEAKLK